ncbi:Flp family type IVb pilin [Phreatobacter aquaticus]|jgi:pilus assembly protein Flp/PilA|uniref:Flp family type IVb pilin n=1 Tax=Phreatobacter aquaticus TaxID=2570229 RepID=A0A4D7QIQ0_9HYPH|nr:Flp family type IVb pilin [Phreatobacter aquaticus]QCK85304.1 Flp family type IVb pilin [Phreatobacter aquaticus]
MKTILARFAKDQSGATAIEYGLIAAGIAAVVIVAVNTMGSNTLNAFNRVNNGFATK